MRILDVNRKLFAVALCLIMVVMFSSIVFADGVTFPPTCDTVAKQRDFLAELDVKLKEEHNAQGVAFRAKRAELDAMINQSTKSLKYVKTHWATIIASVPEGDRVQATKLRDEADTLLTILKVYQENTFIKQSKVIQKNINDIATYKEENIDGIISNVKQKGTDKDVWRPELDVIDISVLVSP